MTDPRIAALAEALRRHLHAGKPCTHEPICADNAAVLLGLLPPDWCGHDAFWNPPPLPQGKPVDIKTLRMDVTDEEADAFIAAIEEPSEIVRLRRIEGAARAHVESECRCGAESHNTGCALVETEIALRAELEADR